MYCVTYMHNINVMIYVLRHIHAQHKRNDICSFEFKRQNRKTLFIRLNLMSVGKKPLYQIRIFTKNICMDNFDSKIQGMYPNDKNAIQTGSIFFASTFLNRFFYKFYFYLYNNYYSCHKL